MRLTPLVVSGNIAHMTLGEQRGTVFFVCETQPLMTLKTFGPPTKCPVCKAEYPISREAACTPITSSQA